MAAFQFAEALHGFGGLDRVAQALISEAQLIVSFGIIRVGSDGPFQKRYGFAGIAPGAGDLAEIE